MVPRIGLEPATNGGLPHNSLFFVCIVVGYLSPLIQPFIWSSLTVMVTRTGASRRN